MTKYRWLRPNLLMVTQVSSRDAREGGESPPLPRNCNRHVILRHGIESLRKREGPIQTYYAKPEVRRPVPRTHLLLHVSREDVS